MNCPHCQSVNEETQKFCRNCGAEFEMSCSGCGEAILPNDKFCGACGLELEVSKKPAGKKEEVASERKFITALFADISGYTTISERLDPEEVKDLVSHLIAEIALVVIKYDGQIEKFAGDQVMALFGVPRAHEDDPVRAINAAREIHQVAGKISPKVQRAIGQPLEIHIGINTGLAVTGPIDFEKAAARHIAGDTINVASRLCTLAKPGEILVGNATYAQAGGFFAFEPLGPVEVKGKTIPVRAYRLIAPRELPAKTHRISGRRARLIGRQREMEAMTQAMTRLRDSGQYSVIAIRGEAGTGKSRLIEEFRATLDLKKIRWIEGHAYAYTQNISYSPLINLIKQDLAIEESDTPAGVAAKLEARLAGLVDLKEEVAPYLGGLLSLPYPKAANMSPEFWKFRLHRAIRAVLRAQAKQALVVICFEDLHWADPLFLNFLHDAVLEQIPGIILLYTYRPPLDLFNPDEIRVMGESYQEIQLQELSGSEMQEMLASILQIDAVPDDLQRLVQEKVGTNPFYLEEMINSLIESGTLQPDQGSWRLTGTIGESDIPSSIHAVIASRIDRLEMQAKTLLQEASVIGRTVPYEILKGITRHAYTLDRLLMELEDIGLLRKSSQSEQEYEFKHVLIQEVVYSGLLKKDRQTMHKLIGLYMEEVFYDRLPEFYETLAFHFRHSELSQKALDYLRKSGRKSLKKYAVQESHQYYHRAFQILQQSQGDTEEENGLRIDFLNEWAEVFYYRADFTGFSKLFLAHQEMAESLSDKELKGVFYGWLCITLFCAGKVDRSYKISLKALELGKEAGSKAAIGLACANLTWCCAELKLLDEGIQYGEEVIARGMDWEPMTFFSSLGGLGMIYLFKGDSRKNFELGRILLEFGERNSDLRSLVVGYICTSYGYFTDGDFFMAVEWGQKAVELSNDPLFTVWPKLALTTYYVQNEQIKEAGEILREIIPICKSLGMDYIVTLAQGLQGIVLIAEGQFSRGLKMIQAGSRVFTNNGRLLSLYILEFSLAEIYFQMATQSRRLGFWPVVKNLGFLIKEAPFAKRKAEAYLSKLIQVGQEIGARGFMQNHAALNLELLQLGSKKAKG